MLTVIQAANELVILATYTAVKTAHQEQIKELWWNKKHQSCTLHFATEKSKQDFFQLVSELEGV